MHGKLRNHLAAIVAAALIVTLAAPGARAEGQCSGHDLLSKPRPPGSCADVKPEVFPAPDQRTVAEVFPADVSLYATPDMESRIVMIRAADGASRNTLDYASPKGANGYYVVVAAWSPDSQYFAYSLSSSGGHSPWSFPLGVYSVKKNLFASFNDMIGGRPTVSEQFKFTGPHSLTASTWKQQGDLDHQIPVTVDLDAMFARLPGPLQ